MKNDPLVAKLYNKMQWEQNEYRAWMLAQLPEEILNHAYEYSSREDILIALENASLRPAQLRALLESQAPLADIYKDYRDCDINTLNVMTLCIADRADTDLMESTKKNWPPVYYQTGRYARKHEELPQYRASMKLNEECRDEIDDAISYNYNGLCLDDGAVQQVLAGYGAERTRYVNEEPMEVTFTYDGEAVQVLAVQHQDSKRFVRLDGVEPQFSESELRAFFTQLKKLPPEMRQEYQAENQPVQQSIPIDRIYEDGTWRCGNVYSQMWSMPDINFTMSDEDNKAKILNLLGKVYMGVPSDCWLKICIVSQRMDEKSFRENVLLHRNLDGLDKWRIERNRRIRQCVQDAGNVVQHKYLILSTNKQNVTDV